MVQLNNTFKQLAVRDESTRSKQGPASRTKPATSTSLASGATPDLSRATTRLLQLVSRLSAPLRRSNRFTPTLQHVKSLLYNKEYLAAFGTESDEGEQWREVYFARWTPARAVLYHRAFQELRIAEILGWEENERDRERLELAAERQRKRGGVAPAAASSSGEPVDGPPPATTATDGAAEAKEVIMIGSGAGAELLALGCVLGSAPSVEGRARSPIKVRAIDQGSWGGLVTKMDAGMKEEWPLTLSQMDLEFVQGDLLSAYSVAPPPPPPSSPENEPSTTTTTTTTPSLPAVKLDLGSPRLKLVTILFTITELLLQSRVSTLRFLSTLTSDAPRGLHLLIIESASLALIPIGTSGRTYPLGTLLDHALCGSGGQAGKWEVVKSEEAKWFRMPDGAEDVYNRDVAETGKGIKVKLENSRVVLRLYRKL